MGLAFFVQGVVVDVLQKVKDRVGVLLDEAVCNLSLSVPWGGIVAGCQHEQQEEDAGRQQTGGYVVDMIIVYFDRKDTAFQRNAKLFTCFFAF